MTVLVNEVSARADRRIYRKHALSHPFTPFSRLPSEAMRQRHSCRFGSENPPGMCPICGHPILVAGVDRRPNTPDLQGKRIRANGSSPACHAEGRGFESLQPLGRKALQIGGFFVGLTTRMWRGSPRRHQSAPELRRRRVRPSTLDCATRSRGVACAGPGWPRSLFSCRRRAAAFHQMRGMSRLWCSA